MKKTLYEVMITTSKLHQNHHHTVCQLLNKSKQQMQKNRTGVLQKEEQLTRVGL